MTTLLTRCNTNKNTIKTNSNLKTILEYVISFIFAISPLLTYYDVPFTTFSFSSFIYLLLVFLLFVYIYKFGSKKINDESIKIYTAIAFYNLICSIFIMFTGRIHGKEYTHIFLLASLFCIILISKINSKEIMSKFRTLFFFICFVISIVAIIEELIYLYNGSCFPIKLPFLRLNDAYIALDYRFGYNGRGDFMGFSPFFSEPSHMAQYFMLAFVLLFQEIGSKRHAKKEWLLFLLMSIAIVISTSSFGLASLAIILVTYCFIKKSKFTKLFRKLIGIAAIILLIILIFAPDNILSYEIKTLFEGLSTGNDKSTYRIYRGLAYFVQFPSINKIFGIGYNNFSNFILEHNLYYEFEISSNTIVTEYLNGVSQALVYNGIIGFILLCLFFILLFYRGNAESKTMTIALILLMCVTSTYLRGNSVFYIMIIIMTKYNKSVTNKGKIYG